MIEESWNAKRITLETRVWYGLSKPIVMITSAPSLIATPMGMGSDRKPST